MIIQDDQYVALVTGATGLVGRHIVQHLSAQEGWQVIAVTRQGDTGLDYEETKVLGKEVKCITVPSLTNKAAVQWAFENLRDVTHLFHCAFHAEEHPRTTNDHEAEDIVKEVKANLSMLVNVVEALEAGPCKDTLRHVYLQAGTKWYGMHPGQRKTPAKEDDPRSLTPHFYYALEDYARYRVEDNAQWTWSELRPHIIVGYSPHSVMNLLNSIGVYAAVTQALGLPFRFPGSDAAYNAITECVDARLLAEAAVYSSMAPECHNQAFNVSNGDVFRWSEMWPRIAHHFGLELAHPQKECLAKVMNTPEKKAAWRALSREHGLVHRSLEQLVSWEYADYMLSEMEHDFFTSTVLLTQAGFEGQCLDSADTWIEHLQFLIDMAVLPPLGTKERETQSKQRLQRLQKGQRPLLGEQVVQLQQAPPRYKALVAAVDAPEGADWLKAIYDTVQEVNAY